MIPIHRLLLTLLMVSFSSGVDPRYEFDSRCPFATIIDSPNIHRHCEYCIYMVKLLSPTDTIQNCTNICCSDWSCLSFGYSNRYIFGLSGIWTVDKSFLSVLIIQIDAKSIQIISTLPKSTGWTRIDGYILDSNTINVCFDCGSQRPLKTIAILTDNLKTLAFINTTLIIHYKDDLVPFCILMDDVPPPTTVTNGIFTYGYRSILQPINKPPFPVSSRIKNAFIDSNALFGPSGDEFPTTWSFDNYQYTGSGDNFQPSPGLYNWSYTSPASLFRINSRFPTKGAFPGDFFIVQGDPFPISNSTLALNNCPGWGTSLTNIKSSGILEANGILYWAVACFNYGDDPILNRQRYGPSWIASSIDYGITWDEPLKPQFNGRFSAPRLVNAGQSYKDAPDPEHVYVLFPGTENDAAFFELNDMVWLGRASISTMDVWEYFSGLDEDENPMWNFDSSIAQHVMEWPLHLSIQQVTYHPELKLYLAPSWVWISMDGNPRPDHSPDERNDRLPRQRTWLILLEAKNLWGPWSVFYSDDNWRLFDNSSGGYTPVFPSAWINGSTLLMVSTQCCPWTPEFLPINHYNFIVQTVQLNLNFEG